MKATKTVFLETFFLSYWQYHAISTSGQQMLFLFVKGTIEYQNYGKLSHFHLIWQSRNRDYICRLIFTEGC
jgi:hypothetical protein